MVEMMNAVVDGVPGHRGQVKGYNVGGKTGTTLVSIPTGYALDSTIASFVGFAPAEDPAFIMLVKIDQPQDDPLGGVVAAPVFGKLAPQILTYLNIPPSSSPLALDGGTPMSNLPPTPSPSFPEGSERGAPGLLPSPKSERGWGVRLRNASATCARCDASPPLCTHPQDQRDVHRRSGS